MAKGETRFATLKMTVGTVKQIHRKTVYKKNTQHTCVRKDIIHRSQRYTKDRNYAIIGNPTPRNNRGVYNTDK